MITVSLTINGETHTATIDDSTMSEEESRQVKEYALNHLKPIPERRRRKAESNRYEAKMRDWRKRVDDKKQRIIGIAINNTPLFRGPLLEQYKSAVAWGDFDTIAPMVYNSREIAFISEIRSKVPYSEYEELRAVQDEFYKLRDEWVVE